MSPWPWAYEKIIVHRCGGALAPENTLAGLAVTARLGLRSVEFDAMLSADGQPVVIHDSTLERTTDGRGEVASWTAAALGRLDAGRSYHSAFAGEALPSLDAVLARCADLGLTANVEIKPAPGQDETTGRMVARHVCGCRPGSVLLSSFSESALTAAAAEAPAVPRALVVEAVPADWPDHLKRLGAVALHCDARLMDPARMGELLAARVPVALWTVNDPRVAARWWQAGAAAMITDRPDLLA